MRDSGIESTLKGEITPDGLDGQPILLLQWSTREFNMSIPFRLHAKFEEAVYQAFPLHPVPKLDDWVPQTWLERSAKPLFAGRTWPEVVGMRMVTGELDGGLFNWMGSIPDHVVAYCLPPQGPNYPGENACIGKRLEIMFTCYSDSDERHCKQVAEQSSGLATCHSCLAKVTTGQCRK